MKITIKEALYFAPEEYSAETSLEAYRKIGPWLEDFCRLHGYVNRKTGEVKTHQAFNLLFSGQPRSKPETAFLNRLMREIERRYPGNEYPKACHSLPEVEPIGPQIKEYELHGKTPRFNHPDEAIAYINKMLADGPSKALN